MGERGPSNLIVWAVSRFPYASPATVAIFAMSVQRWRPSRPSIISRGADDARRSSSQSRTSSAASKSSSWTLNPLLRGACCSASTATPRGPSVLGSRARRVPPGRRTAVWFPVCAHQVIVGIPVQLSVEDDLALLFHCLVGDPSEPSASRWAGSDHISISVLLGFPQISA
jgi:hypothetical protein